MKTWAVACALVVCATSGGACGKKKQASGVAEGGAAARKQGGKNALGDDVSRKPPRVRRQLAPITVDEAAPMLPVPDGARVIHAAQKAAVGERVEVSFCMDGAIADVAEAVRKRYSDAGWGGLAVSAATAGENRATIAGSKPPLNLFGTVSRGKWQECDTDKNQTLVTIGAHKLVDASGPAPTPGAVGPSGVTRQRLGDPGGARNP
jgi:hypothetical protein